MPVKPIPLTLGFYQAQSLTAEAQRCINLYPEKNPEDASFPYSLYPVPGLITLTSPAAPAPGRGLYLASNGTLYAVAGSLVYQVSPTDWSMTAIGELGTSTGLVGIKDNTVDLLVSDGSNQCYSAEIAQPFLRPVSDPNCVGSNFVDLIDGFFLLNQPETRNFYSSLETSVVFDPTFIAAKNGGNDTLQRVTAVHREAWLVGTDTCEVWYDAGNTDGISFSLIPGAYVMHGTSAPASVAVWDNAIFFLGQSPQGDAYVLMGLNYAAKPISTVALSKELSTYLTLSDAEAYCYEQFGHAFYVLNFPTADKTWAYDITEGLWHERAFTDLNGVLHRARPCSVISAFGKVLAQDWQSGALYEMLDNVFTDVIWEEPATAGTTDPATPTPTLTSNILQVYAPVTGGGSTPAKALVDWDKGIIYELMSRADATVDGLYAVSMTNYNTPYAKRLASTFPPRGSNAGNPVFEVSAQSTDALFVTGTISNLTMLYKVDKVTFSIRSYFGFDTSASYTTPDSQLQYPNSMAYNTIGKDEYLITGQLVNKKGKVFTVTGDTFLWLYFDYNLPLDDVYCVAGPNTGNKCSFFLANVNHSGPYSDPIKVYEMVVLREARLVADDKQPPGFSLSNPYISVGHIGDISPTNIDPAWTTIAAMESLGYDGTDGNILMLVFTNDAVTHKNYILKYNVTTAVVAWTIPLTSLVGDLSQYRITYGICALKLTITAGFYAILVIDTVLGTVLATYPFTGVLAATWAFDDTTGLLVSNGQYASGGGVTPIGGTPNNFGGSPGLDGGWFILSWAQNATVGGTLAQGGAGGVTPRGSFVVPGAVAPNEMFFAKSFPHQVSGGNRIQLNALSVKVDAGGVSTNTVPTFTMKYSCNGGQSYGDPISVSGGLPGEYFTQPIWRQLGIALGRDVVFDVSWSGAGCKALLGAWLDAIGLDT